MKIRTRAEENLRPPRRVHPIPTPTEELWLHHTAGPRHQTWRHIQDHHMDVRGWSDIGYSFGVRGGAVMEGRGAGVAGGHTSGRNTVSHGIVLLGNFEESVPLPTEIRTLAWLVAHGALSGWWRTYITGPHGRAPGSITACAGRHLNALIPHINEQAKKIIDTLTGPQQPPVPPPPVPTSPRFEPPYRLTGIVDALPAPGGGVWLLGEDGGLYAFGGAPFHGTVTGKPYWAGRKAARLLPHGDRYVVQATTGETYGYGGF